MKKLFVLFLSLCYLVLSSGFTKYSHLCKKMAVQQYGLTNTYHQNSDKPCPFCSAKDKNLNKKKKECCQHETQIAKTDDSVKQQSNVDLSVKFWGEAIPNKMLGTVFDVVTITNETQSTKHFLSSKVPIRGNPLYILHCVYRI